MGAQIWVYSPDGELGLLDNNDPDEPAEEFAAGYGVEHYPDCIYFFGGGVGIFPAKDEDMGLAPEPNPDEYVWVLSEIGTPFGVPLRVYDADRTLDPEQWAAKWGSQIYPDAIYFFGPEDL